MADYFGPMWAGSQPERNYRFTRLYDGASIDLNPSEIAMLMVGLHIAVEAHPGTDLAAEYQLLLARFQAFQKADNG